MNLEKPVLEKLVQLLLRSQWGQSCPDPGQLQLQVLVLHLLEVLQNYFCFPAVEPLQEDFAETLKGPFSGEDGGD